MFAELAYESAGFRLIGKLVEAAEQGGSLGSDQERREGRHDLLDHAERSLAKPSRGKIAKSRREDRAEGIELGADACFTRRVIRRVPVGRFPATGELRDGRYR